MPNENLLAFVKSELAQGQTEYTIRASLLQAGWMQKDIDDAFIFVKGTSQIAPQVPASVVQPVQIQTKSKFFSWKGRIGRLRYLVSSVVLGIILLIINTVLFFLSVSMMFASLVFGVWGFLIVPSLVILWLCVEAFLFSFILVKRFHDINKSGWYFWACLVPFYNFYLALSLLLECGTEGANQYGGDPLPVGKNHNGLVARLGKNVWFKVIVTILLSLIAIFAFVSDSIDKQHSQQQLQQTIDQSILNAVASSTRATTPNQQTSTPSIQITSPTSADIWNLNLNTPHEVTWQSQGLDPNSQAYVYIYLPSGLQCDLGTEPMSVGKMNVVLSQITATTCGGIPPKLVAGKYRFVVNTPAQNGSILATDGSDLFTVISDTSTAPSTNVVPAPISNSKPYIDPSSVSVITGPQPGTDVSLLGSGFGSSPTILITGNGYPYTSLKPVSVESWSSTSTRIEFQLPPDIANSTDTYSVEVINNGVASNPVNVTPVGFQG